MRFARLVNGFSEIGFCVPKFEVGKGMKDLVRRVVADGIAWAGGQTELAAAIEPLVGRLYSSQNVSAWKTGKADPYAHVILAIAKVAGISIDELVLEGSRANQLDRVEEATTRLEETLRDFQGRLRKVEERLAEQQPRLLSAGDPPPGPLLRG